MAIFTQNFQKNQPSNWPPNASCPNNAPSWLNMSILGWQRTARSFGFLELKNTFFKSGNEMCKRGWEFLESLQNAPIYKIFWKSLKMKSAYTPFEENVPTNHLFPKKRQHLTFFLSLWIIKKKVLIKGKKREKLQVRAEISPFLTMNKQKKEEEKIARNFPSLISHCCCLKSKMLVIFRKNRDYTLSFKSVIFTFNFE